MQSCPTPPRAPLVVYLQLWTGVGLELLALSKTRPPAGAAMLLEPLQPCSLPSSCRQVSCRGPSIAASEAGLAKRGSSGHAMFLGGLEQPLCRQPPCWCVPAFDHTILSRMLLREAEVDIRLHWLICSCSRQAHHSAHEAFQCLWSCCQMKPKCALQSISTVAPC